MFRNQHRNKVRIRAKEMHNSLKVELDKTTKGDIAYGVEKIPEKQRKLNTKMGWNNHRFDAFRCTRICFAFRIVYVSG